MTDPTPIRKPGNDPELARKITEFAQRLGVKPNPTGYAIAYDGLAGEKYCVIDLMIAFLDKVEKHK